MVDTADSSIYKISHFLLCQKHKNINTNNNNFFNESIQISNY